MRGTGPSARYSLLLYSAPFLSGVSSSLNQVFMSISKTVALQSCDLKRAVTWAAHSMTAADATPIPSLPMRGMARMWVPTAAIQPCCTCTRFTEG